MSQEQTGRTRSEKSPVAQMKMKRSVSPDGRIDSLSVEITSDLDSLAPDEVVERALAVLSFEGKIVKVFLGKGEKMLSPAEGNGTDGTPARMISVGGMETRWGRRLFVLFDVDGERTRLFGNKRQVAAVVAKAGSRLKEDTIDEGLDLDLSCRVVTGRTPDDRYLTIEKVLPASAS